MWGTARNVKSGVFHSFTFRAHLDMWYAYLIFPRLGPIGEKGKKEKKKEKFGSGGVIILFTVGLPDFRDVWSCFY